MGVVRRGRPLKLISRFSLRQLSATRLSLGVGDTLNGNATPAFATAWSSRACWAMSVAPTLTAVEPPYVQVEIRDCPGAGRPWGWDVVIPSWVDGGTIHSWVVPGELGRPHCRVCRFGVQAITGRQSHRGLPNGVNMRRVPKHRIALHARRSTGQSSVVEIEDCAGTYAWDRGAVCTGCNLAPVLLGHAKTLPVHKPFKRGTMVDIMDCRGSGRWLGQCTDCPFDMRAKHLLGRIPTHKIALHV